MFPFLEERMGGKTSIKGNDKIREILESEPFRSLEHLNILPLIYDEKRKLCNIMIFDIEKAKRDAYKVEYVKPNQDNRRKYPVFIFYNEKDEYICEVRYGGKDANALQRGFWTHTKRAEQYFDSLTGGWIDYSDNEVLVKLFRYALVSSEEGHQKAVENLLSDIKRLKKM
ncbi:MAG: hypothetical protein GXO48_02345 [Chlorobi bacterium]|nr:hypothetical protein [Chlorobiota bacterium]